MDSMRMGVCQRSYDSPHGNTWPTRASGGNGTACGDRLNPPFALDFDMDAHDAVKAPRFVLQYLGNSIPYLAGTDLRLEKEFSEKTRAALSAHGHRLLDPNGSLGMLNGIMIYLRTGVLSGGADPRREGHAAGW